jgi:penicillin-binding protein 2
MKWVMRKKEFLKQKIDEIFEIRIKCLKIIFLVFFFGIFLRLFNLQVLKYSKYSIIERKTRYAKIKIIGERGKIYDRKGNLLAFNVPNYSIYFDTWMLNNLKEKNPKYLNELKKHLSEILKIDEKRIEEKMRESYALIKKNIDIEEYEKIKILKVYILKKIIRGFIHMEDTLATYLGIQMLMEMGLKELNISMIHFLKGKMVYILY